MIKLCKLKSAIILKDRVYMPFDHDHHSKMLEELGIQDKTQFPNFVRIETIPKDGNLFNHNEDNWLYSVDQDYLLEWYMVDIDKYREMAESKLKEWFEQRFILDIKEIRNISEGRYFVKNATVKACDSATVEACGSATVKAWDSATVEACDSASIFVPSHAYKIKNIQIKDYATIKDMRFTPPKIYIANNFEIVTSNADDKEICDGRK